jgi:AraC-like DNA-binding protein
MEHAEGCASAKESYTLLWLIFSKRTMIAFACRHIPRKGWYSFMNRSLNSNRVHILRDLIQNGGRDFSIERRDRIRANIIAVLSELYAKEISTSKNSKPYPRSNNYADVLDSLYDFIETHYADRLSVQHLAGIAGMSTCYLNRLFKRQFGVGIQEHVISTRMVAAMKMLKTGKYMIKQVALKCGYDDPLYFSKAFRKYHGCSPSSTF